MAICSYFILLYIWNNFLFLIKAKDCFKERKFRGKKAKAVHFRFLASAKFLHWNCTWTLSSSSFFFSHYCCCDMGKHLSTEGWIIAMHHQPSHTAHQSGFPSHFLQLLNVNIILWGLACRAFHTSLPEHWARVVFQKSNAALSTGNCALAYTSEKKGGKQPKNQFMLLMWGGPELISGVSEVLNTITTHRNDQFSVRLLRQSFLSHVSQPLFTTYTCKTQKGTCRDTLLHFSKFPIALLLKKYFTTESNWDKILASLWILCV